MPTPGSRRSRPKSLADPRRALVVALLVVFAQPATAQSPLVAYKVVGDGAPEPLTSAPGDPARGRKIVVERQTGLCLLCHSGPFPEQRFQGDIGPDLTGVGERLSVAQLRLRIIDGTRLNPQTIMPSYYRVAGLERVAPAWRGKPILDAQQIEDVVAFLTTLRDAPAAKETP